MTDYDCVFTLAAPAALEEELLDFLRAHSDWATGFSIVQGEGVGAGSSLRSTIEQVRGRAKRIFIQVLMREKDREVLVAALKAEYSSGEILWWTTPVLASGRLL